MNFDISRLLEQWEYQPGQVMVRKFTAKDGTEKIQLRVDLGLLQMNAEGRPDGKRPLGHPSYFDFLLKKLEDYCQERNGEDEGFTLTGEECAKLQMEALQFHHRYICLLQLEDFEAAISDTARNLEVLDFVDEYAENDELAWALQQFRPQVLMLQTRAKASLNLEAEHYQEAINEIEEGLRLIREFYETTGRSDLEEQSPEIHSLSTWLEDVQQERPLSTRQKLENDLEKAIRVEDFEKAAEVRDALKNLKSSD